ncbi:MAG: hypothetical protein ACYS0C_00570 [Planctomycetota bacterium]|jgi:hypothetical protein
MKIDTNQIQEILEKLSSRQPNSAKPLTNNDADASLQANFSSLIDEASQPTQTDTKAVQQAQKLLLSGQLETPENIRAAAENIIKFGI